MLIHMQFAVTVGRSIGSLLWFFLLVPKEWNHSVTNCHQLKMPAADGKMRLTDVADTEQLFRLIQSIPSPHAEGNLAAPRRPRRQHWSSRSHVHLPPQDPPPQIHHRGARDAGGAGGGNCFCSVLKLPVRQAVGCRAGEDAISIHRGQCLSCRRYCIPWFWHCRCSKGCSHPRGRPI